MVVIWEAFGMFWVASGFSQFSSTSLSSKLFNSFNYIPSVPLIETLTLPLCGPLLLPLNFESKESRMSQSDTFGYFYAEGGSSARWDVAKRQIPLIYKSILEGGDFSFKLCPHPPRWSVQ